MGENSIKCVTEYIQQVEKILDEIKGKDELCNIWFRGEQSNKVYTPLIPKIYRVYNDDTQKAYCNYAKHIEPNLKAEFSRQATGYLNNISVNRSRWNDYYLMQHYGMSTRLLDWSESALIALYFSVESLLDADSVVYILDPYKLNEYTINNLFGGSIKFRGLICPKDNLPDELLINERGQLNLNELSRIYLDMEFRDGKSYHPMAIAPPHLDNRMIAQLSTFTIFGNKVNGLLSIGNHEEFLRTITIDKEYKKKILRQLSWLGISHKSIYPGLEGLSRSISDNYNDDHILKRQ